MKKRGNKINQIIITAICLVLLLQGCGSLPYDRADIKHDCMHMVYYDAGMESRPKIYGKNFSKDNYETAYLAFPETKELYESGRNSETLGWTMMGIGGAGMAISMFMLFKALFDWSSDTTAQDAMIGLIGFGASVPVLAFGGAFAAQGQSEYIEGLYLYNVLSGKNEFSKKLSPFCGDYYYPYVDFWGGLNIKGYFSGKTYALDDEGIISSLSFYNPEFAKVQEYALRPIGFYVLMTLTTIPLTFPGLAFAFLGAQAQVDLYRLYYDSINLHNYNCFCRE